MSHCKAKVVKKVSALVLLLVVISLGAMQVGAATKLPSFSLPDVTNGNMVNSSQFDGQVLLVTFFATWCVPCREEMPILIKLQQDYKERGFSVVGLSIDTDGMELVKKLVEKEKLNYPVLLADRKVADGFGGISGVPTSFLVNKRGNVVKRYIGMVSEEVLLNDLELVMH